MRPLKAVALATGFSALIYGLVTVIGFNSYTWTLIFYSYILLALIISLKASGLEKSDFTDLRNKLIYVKDLEERRAVKILTGEEFKIKDVEKIQ